MTIDHFRPRRRKDDLMTTIWHKRHAPFGVILSVNPDKATRGIAPQGRKT
jgi:hypothetical protein